MKKGMRTKENSCSRPIFDSRGLVSKGLLASLDYISQATSLPPEGTSAQSFFVSLIESLLLSDISVLNGKDQYEIHILDTYCSLLSNKFKPL